MTGQTRGKQDTSSTGTRTPRSAQSTDRATRGQARAGAAEVSVLPSSGDSPELEPVDQRVMLVKQQHMLWETLQTCSDQRGLASISKELREVTRAIEALPDPKKVTSIERLRASREARRAAALEAVDTGRKGQ